MMSERPVAIVTGASRGIGRAVAMELAGLDFDVVVNHVRASSERVDLTQTRIESFGVRCLTVQADVGNADDRITLVEKAKVAFGRCDLLVNNAGVAPVKRMSVLETTEESFDRVMNINLKGPFFLSQLVAKWMLEQKVRHSERPFRIVNISSISAWASSPLRSEYCISKAGMSMMTQLFAHYLAERGVGVFEIQPGIISTDMTQEVKDKYAKLIAEGLSPIRRWGKPEDVGKAVRAIADGGLDFSPGQVIHVDGGFHIRRL